MTEEVRSWLRDYYGTRLASSDDLQTTACCASGPPPQFLHGPLGNIHPDVQARFYGCGYPAPHALRGATVLDLGCGTGRDVYLISQLVGPEGFVHGLDMTAEQLAVAADTLDWHMERFGFARANVAFHQGYIEDLSAFPDGSVDVVVSNCVVNLSPHKERVLSEVWRVLKPGGELHLSDVVADRRLPEALARDAVLHAECLGGAMYDHDFEVLARRTGFLDPREVARAPIETRDAEIARKVGAARFFSVTMRLFKLTDLDDRCEDYGQVATYDGGIPGAEGVFWLDDHHAFEVGRPERVCGNTAAMLAETRFAPWFTVVGDRSVHHGEFPCGPTVAAQVREDSAPAACC